MSVHQAINPWTVDYADGSDPRIISVPHAWRLDLPPYEEGPVIYRTKINVPADDPHLEFRGVSYAADVRVDGELVCHHEGIWDAFSFSLRKWAKKKVEVEVTVVKNGGPTYPVKDVASGFIPFVYHTFGGIHGEVILHQGPPQLEHPAKPSRVRVEGTKVYVDGKPFYLRGVLTWGWYPEHGHTNPPDHVIRREVRQAKALGFNAIKFCLWVPPHRYLEILQEEGMFAWMELPLWDPSADPEKREKTGVELERIVRQYRHHDTILLWTIGCELSEGSPADFRQYMTQMVRNLTGCPLVKDNSGGAEMYGGDLREYGTFYDMHPYAEAPFFPVVLDSLLPGGRTSLPTYLGECNDADVHRDISRLGDETPYWASTLRELNDQGVRWQHDLPRFLGNSRFAQEPEANCHEQLMESSRLLTLFVRKYVTEQFRMRDGIGGYVLTGLRDTPISTAGFIDDWGQNRYSPEETLPWNGSDVLFLLPTRRPPWVNGGNRPGWLDPFAFFCGQVFWKIGIHSERGASGGLAWQILDERGDVVARGAEAPETAEAMTSTQVGSIHWECDKPGQYRLDVRYGDATNSWRFWVIERLSAPLEGWNLTDPACLFGSLKVTEGAKTISTRSKLTGPGIAFMVDEGTVPMPFWRESAYVFDSTFWFGPAFVDQWERFMSVSPDRALDPAFVAQLPDAEVLLNRIDARTYAEHALLVRSGSRYYTTLRPFGGLGIQPRFADNPSGHALLRLLVDAVN